MMGGIGMHALRPLALKLRDGFGIRHFVETGTYKAITTCWAADHFDQVTTIESYEPYHRAALQNHGWRKNVNFVYGSSGERLQDCLPDEPALVWLDAHWCGSYELSAGMPDECPILDELAALNASPVNHFVLIDDARYFVGRPPRPHDPAQWPSYDEIVKLLTAVHPRKVYVWKDTIIAVPAKASKVVREVAGIDADMKIVVLTSNDYQHLLKPFAYLFNKHWSAQQPVTIVRHEIRPRGLPGNFGNFAVGVQADYTWSEGLIKYLTYLNEQHLVLLLEDYFLTSRVDVARIQALHELMEMRPEIAKIDLSGDLLNRPHTDFEDGLAKADDTTLFQTSLQAAIWRKDFLLHFLEPSETPWNFEKKGGQRVVKARKSGKFNGLVLGTKNPPLQYVNAVGGEGHNPGELDMSKIPAGLIDELKGAGTL